VLRKNLSLAGAKYKELTTREEKGERRTESKKHDAGVSKGDELGSRP